MPEISYKQIWRFVIQNQNSWVLFEHGTVVIFLPDEAAIIQSIKAEAINRLKQLDAKSVAIAELVGQGLGWIVNCGDDFILSYVPHGDYSSRYERITAMIEEQKRDQQELKITHVFHRR